VYPVAMEEPYNVRWDTSRTRRYRTSTTLDRSQFYDRSVFTLFVPRDMALFGACRPDGDHSDVNFFPETSSGVKLAQQVCAGCPMRSECLEHALVNNLDHGVWGGESERARRRIRRQRRWDAEQAVELARLSAVHAEAARDAAQLRRELAS
jgi:hypothetical protein